MKSPLQRAEKTLLASTVLLCVPALVLGWFYQKQNELPPTPVAAKPVPPSPNAFDWIMAAAKQMTPVPTPKITASGCTSSGIDIEGSCDVWQEPKPYTRAYNRAFPLRSKQAYLQANSRALRLWRHSLQMRSMAPETPFVTPNSIWKERRLLSLLVQTQARACWQAGKTGKSLDWLLAWHRDACRSALSFYDGKAHSAGIYRFDAARAQRRAAMDELELLAPHLSAAQTRRAAISLQANRELLPPRLQALRVTRDADLEFARAVCGCNDLRRYFNFQFPQNTDVGAAEELRFRWANKKAGLRKLAAQWDWIIGQSQSPTPGFGQNMPESLLFDQSDIFRVMQTDWSHLKSSNAEVDAREVVFLTALATRSFALQQGHNPRYLRELMPAYLHRVEADPFDPKQQLIYRSQPQTYATFQLGQPIFKRPLPKNAFPVDPLLTGPPGAEPSGVPPAVTSGPILGYSYTATSATLPFLLYSVGANRRDDSSVGVQTAQPNPFAPRAPETPDNDDVLARAAWFNVLEMEREESQNRAKEKAGIGRAPP